MYASCSLGMDLRASSMSVGAQNGTSNNGVRNSDDLNKDLIKKISAYMDQQEKKIANLEKLAHYRCQTSCYKLMVSWEDQPPTGWEKHVDIKFEHGFSKKPLVLAAPVQLWMFDSNRATSAYFGWSTYAEDITKYGFKLSMYASDIKIGIYHTCYIACGDCKDC